MKRTFVVLSVLLLCVFPGRASFAQGDLEIKRADNVTRDEWGLTEYEWVSNDGPGLRRLAGLPSTIDKVRAGADRGDPKALSLLSSAYATGTGVPLDANRALQLARKAAAMGSPVGHFMLGLDYFFGTGTPVNVSKYESEMEAAAEAGSLVAAYNLGLDYLNGKNVPQSIEKTHRYFGMAAKGGFPRGESAYGSSLFLKPGDDGLQAERWIAQGAEDKDPLGIYWHDQIETQHEISKEIGKFFIASVGGHLLGWHTNDHGVIVANPCQMELLASQNGQTHLLTVSWAQSKAEFRPPNGIHIDGVIADGGADQTEGYREMYLGLHRDQENNDDEKDRLHMLWRDMAHLSGLCHKPSPTYK